jgi:hypothetical protein
LIGSWEEGSADAWPMLGTGSADGVLVILTEDHSLRAAQTAIGRRIQEGRGPRRNLSFPIHYPSGPP